MRIFVRFVAALSLVASLDGCHRTRQSLLAPAALREDYCWWTAYRTSLPLDTVARRFDGALAAIGLMPSVISRAGDTVWVHAGPSVLPNYAGSPIGARVVAYQAGDSTHFRIFIARADSSLDHIRLCQQITRAAAVTAFAPREPDGEEKLDVWKRRPSTR